MILRRDNCLQTFCFKCQGISLTLLVIPWLFCIQALSSEAPAPAPVIGTTDTCPAVLATFPSTFRVITNNRPPYVFVNPKKNGTNAGFTGFLVDLLPILFVEAGLPADRFVYFTSKENTGSGVISEIQAGEADIAAFPLFQTPGRNALIDLTIPYLTAGLVLLVRKIPIPVPAISFLNPFSTNLWLAIIATVLFHTLAQFCISKLASVGHLKTDPNQKHIPDWLSSRTACGKKFFSPSADPEGKEEDSFLYETWLHMLGKRRGLHICDTWASRIVFLSFMLFAVIISASYTANLAAQFSSGLTQPYIGNLQDLADLAKQGGKFARNGEGATISYFKATTDPLALAVAPNAVVANNGSPEGVALVQNKTVAAYITDAAAMTYYAGLTPCDVTIVGDQFGPSHQVLGLPLNSTYTSRISDALLRMRARGDIDRIYRDWVNDLNQCGADTKRTKSYQLTVSHFVGLWYLQLACMGLGALLLMVEHAKQWVGYHMYG